VIEFKAEEGTSFFGLSLVVVGRARPPANVSVTLVYFFLAMMRGPHLFWLYLAWDSVLLFSHYGHGSEDSLLIYSYSLARGPSLGASVGETPLVRGERTQILRKNRGLPATRPVVIPSWSRLFSFVFALFSDIPRFVPSNVNLAGDHIFLILGLFFSWSAFSRVGAMWAYPHGLQNPPNFPVGPRAGFLMISWSGPLAAIQKKEEKVFALFDFWVCNRIEPVTGSFPLSWEASGLLCFYDQSRPFWIEARDKNLRLTNWQKPPGCVVGGCLALEAKICFYRILTPFSLGGD